MIGTFFQCKNCSKAFRKSEYLDNHIQRRHVNRSLAENGIYPLIEQIKRYNSGLFVESSSIDDLKEKIKNLQILLKETSDDLIKERIAREQLQKIIESEIIEKLKFITRDLVCRNRIVKIIRRKIKKKTTRK